jgi:hypothetical protein
MKALKNLKIPTIPKTKAGGLKKKKPAKAVTAEAGASTDVIQPFLNLTEIYINQMLDNNYLFVYKDSDRFYWVELLHSWHCHSASCEMVWHVSEALTNPVLLILKKDKNDIKYKEIYYNDTTFSFSDRTVTAVDDNTPFTDKITPSTKKKLGIEWRCNLTLEDFDVARVKTDIAEDNYIVAYGDAVNEYVLLAGEDGLSYQNLSKMADDYNITFELAIQLRDEAWKQVSPDSIREKDADKEQ